MEEQKVFYFEVSGKLEARNENEATDLIHELLSEKTQFKIESLAKED